MSDDRRGDDAWTDPERPPSWGENLTDHGGNVWSMWMRTDGNLNERPHIWHWCDRHVLIAKIRTEGREPADGIEPRWMLAGTEAHDMPSRDPLTLSPSLLVDDCCGLHGFLTGGVWRSC